MDSETWQALANEAEPLLRQFKALALKYQLGTNGLNIAADVDRAWAFMIDDVDGVHYNVEIDPNDVVHVADNKELYVKE